MKTVRPSLILVLIAGILVFPELTLGHGSEKHGEESPAVESKSVEPAPASTPAANDSSDIQAEELPQSRTEDQSNDTHDSAAKIENAKPLAETAAMPAKPDALSRLAKAIEDFSLEDFPTLHPMVVHVPVIMIPVAFVFGLISIFLTSRYFVALATVFAAAGVLGGYIAAFPMHPHTRGLSEAAAWTLQQHDFFAYGTLGITAFAVIVGASALLRPNLWTRGLLALTLLLASLCVSVTAHYGGTLTYVHGVGVNGNYLDSH